MKRTSIPSPLTAPNHSLQTRAPLCILFLFLISWSALAAAQKADSLSRIKNIYIGTSDTGPHAQEIRKFLTQALENDHSVIVVNDPTRADAILNTTSAIWVKSYISVNPRSPGTRFPVYGGYLSAQLDAMDGDALWSYLVTPSSSETSKIPQNLASQLSGKLLSVLHDAASSSPNRPTQGASRIVRLAGATFPAPLYREWIDSFQQRHPDVHMTYSSIGTEAGIQQLHDNKITLAASDVPLSDAYMSQMPVKLLQFATVIGAVVPVYHLPYASQDLNFTPEILAGIYLGKIRRWNDPAIRAINRGVTLPDAEIFVVHRADGSGTTFVFTDFLSKTVPAWKAAPGSGTTINWPIGHPAPGNDGVAALIEKTPNSIGYIELSYAIQRQLSYGNVRNSQGNFTQANLFTLAAAAASTSSDILTQITNAPGKDAYPIASYTWLLVPQTFHDPATKSAVIDFLDWIFTSGQKECSSLAYYPLPKEVLAHEQDMLAKFKAK